ncbi:MAG: HdeA/HdeB family chaperone [Alphaproteobacteria bacterium]|nr:HdeA/HdeB family chaperone [Alphaproteobacteria bacterium]
MKRSLMLTVAAMLWTVLPAQAQKQSFDLSVVTCKQFFEYSKENMGIMLMWLDGYYSDEDAPPVVDFDKMTENSIKLAEYCAKNPGHSVITAADKTLGGN